MKTLLSLLPCMLCHIFTEAQNVGIGTVQPSQKLDVAGNVRADTLIPDALRIAVNAGSGKVLMSDAAGNGAWEVLTLESQEENGNIGYGTWGDCQTNGIISDYQPIADSLGASSDYLGNDVAISGNHAIAGAWKDDNVYTDQGSVSFYYHNGTEWTYTQKIYDSDPVVDGAFGYSVSISGNYAIVGCFADSVVSTRGSASIFHFNGTNWELMEKIYDEGAILYDYFGVDVAIDGNFVVVGEPYDDITNENQGSASIFQLVGSDWQFMTKLIDTTGGMTDLYGRSVAIYGNTVVVGSYLNDINGNTNQGSVFIYTFNGSDWNFAQKLTDNTGEALDGFGWAVAISGTNIAVGVPYDDSPNIEQGSAVFFRYNGTSWVQAKKVTDFMGTAYEYFGESICVSDNYAMVAALYETQEGYDRSAVTIYQTIGNSWQRLQYLTDPGRQPPELFDAVALDNNTGRFLIGVVNFSPGGKILFGKIR